MLRVLMLVTGFPSASDSGTGIFNLRAARALSRRADVSVVHLRSWRPSRPIADAGMIDGLRVWTLAVPQLPRLKRASLELYKATAWPLMKKLLKDRDLVHSVGLSFAGLIGAHSAGLAGVHHVTQLTSELELSTGQLRPNEEAMKNVHAVACNSSALANHFRRAYPSARNVLTIYRGVDLERFHPDRAVDSLRQRSGVRFLYLGGFPVYRTKGGETLLAAWQAAEEILAGRDAHLTIGGPGSTGAAVQRWRSALRFPDRVRLAGMIEPLNVAESLLSADAILVPSLVEGFPNVAVEASACGRAVIASDLDCIAELIVDGETGTLVPPGDAGAWVSALTRAAENRDDLVMLGRRARARAEAHFDAKSYPDNVIDLYHAAMREPQERQAIPWIALS